MESIGHKYPNLGGVGETAKMPAPMSLTDQLNRHEELIKSLQQNADINDKRIHQLEQRVGGQ